MLTEWKGKEIFLRGTIYYRYRETVDMCHLHLLHPASQLCCRHLLTVHYFFCGCFKNPEDTTHSELTGLGPWQTSKDPKHQNSIIFC